MTIKTPIYMDYQATTPTDPRVVEKMLPYFTEKFGNPHSSSHSFGWEVEKAVEEARKKIAKLINASPKEIVFTSGATESNNLAIKGLAHYLKSKGNHIITAKTEHKCVLDSCRYLASEGFDITYLPVEKTGLIDLEKLKNAITDKTILVSIMAVNNETGVIQPLDKIGKICRENKVVFHTDGAQAFGKISLDVKEMQIDMMSISAHKIYGPKGVGALYVGRKPRIKLKAIINGGGQERGMRSGTLAPPLIVGFGEAAEIASTEMETENIRLTGLRDKLLNKIQSKLSETYVNGTLENRLAGNLNISFAGVEGESLMMAIKDLAVSSGSACTSESLESSYVLHAQGLSDDLSHTSIRFGIGRFTTEEEIDYAGDLICEKVENLREMSPLWEMIQEGVDVSKVEWSEH